MAKTAKPKVKWLPDVEESHYAAAACYLALLYRRKDISRILAKLRRTTVVQFKAKDLFRASQLSLLGVSNWHVEKDRRRIRKGTALSPLLLVRDEDHGKVVIADGYHRLCAVYSFDEDAWIRCRIV